MTAEAGQRAAAQKAQETRERILAAAERLFAEHGADGVSMSQLAAAAGVSKGNLFHHFPSKRALRRAVLQRACADFRALVEDLGRADLPSRARLERFVRDHTARLAARRDAVRLILRALLDADPEEARWLAHEVFGEHFAALVARMAGLRPRQADPVTAAFVMVAADVMRFLAGPVLAHLPEAGPVRDDARWARTLAALLGDCGAEDR